ncbi:C4-dicarboxylate-specific signal transduction histidine kinase [Oxalobacteraceae bacterium GrIS 1.11]
MKLRNFSIGARLRWGFGIILTILALMVVVSNILNIRNKDELIDGLGLANAKGMLATAMKNALLEGGIAMRNIGVQTDVGAMEQENARVEAQGARHTAALRKFAAFGLSAGEKGIVANIAQLDHGLAAPLKEAVGNALAFNSPEAAKIIVTRIAQLRDARQHIQQSEKMLAIGQLAAGIAHEINHPIAFI